MFFYQTFFKLKHFELTFFFSNEENYFQKKFRKKMKLTNSSTQFFNAKNLEKKIEIDE